MDGVVTTIGMRDTDVVSTLTRIETFVQGFKQRMEGSPIRVGVEAAAKPGASLAVYGNPLYASVFRDSSAVRAMEERFKAQPGGRGMLGEVGDWASMRYGQASAFVKMAAEINRTVEVVAQAGRAQRDWMISIRETGAEYSRLAQTVGRSMSDLQQRTNSATGDAFGASKNASKSAQSRMDKFWNENAGANGANIVLSDLAAKLARTPGVNSVWDFGTKRNWSEQIDDIVQESYDVPNRIAGQNADAVKRLRSENTARGLEDSKAKFVRDGQEMSARAEAAQREREAKEKTAEAQKKARDEATKQFAIDQLSDLATIRRLQNREKEAKLLEAKADYMRRNLALDNNENLTTDQKSSGQMRSYGIYEMMLKAIDEKEEKMIAARSFDMSSGGGSNTMMAALGINGRTQSTLDKIEANTATDAQTKAQIAAALMAIATKSFGALWG